ncbi:hypothetical protein AB0K15_44560 [Amycolatopsis sp. NPDC049253]|uniref:hypothetical protein n=1 Tax=Amycolatopsis sp. NPDC049253 TaxID=3155274 RepID=UPI00344551EE
MPDRTQHVITNVRITGTTGSAYYHAHHARFACEPPLYTVTGVYHVALLETAEERRISHLRPEVLWTQGNPEVVNTTSSSTGHQAP